MIPNNVQGEVAQEVNERLAKATRELQEKYARGEGGKDVSVDGPSGSAYKEKDARETAAKKKAKDARRAAADANASSGNNQDEMDSDEEEGDEDDYELRQIRDQRLRQIKAQQIQKIENIAKGHGQYREIVQDEFLAEMTNSTRVICHFYHRDFPRCEIMNHHLSKLAPKHIESKFVKIDADKAPFFIDKLKIKSIPTVVLFIDGIAADKIIGFEGLSDGMPVGKEDEWPTIRLARLLAGKNMLSKDNIVDDDEVERNAKMKMEDMRKAYVQHNFEEDDDLELSD